MIDLVATRVSERRHETGQVELSKGASAGFLDMRLQASHGMASPHCRGGNNDRLSNPWLKVISRAAVAGAFFNDRGSNAANGDVTSVEGNEGRYERQ